MSEHVIQNPVPTPEQMAELLGVSPARVKTLRSIMRSQTALSIVQRRRTTTVGAIKKASAYGKVSVARKSKDATRAKTKAR